MHHVFKLKYKRLNNRDFNFDQNNRGHDIFHNRAALPERNSTAVLIKQTITVEHAFVCGDKPAKLRALTHPF